MILRAKYEGEKFKIQHGELIQPIQEDAQIIKEHTDNGWTDERNFRQIASIPSLVFMQHPEFLHDDIALRRWLRSEEGSRYTTVRKGI